MRSSRGTEKVRRHGGAMECRQDHDRHRGQVDRLGESRWRAPSDTPNFEGQLLMGGLPKIYSYVVARDFGFAPNPFHGVCTLATCKPRVRKAAHLGDWVVGTGSAGRKRAGFLVFAMKVEEALTFDEYWTDERFFQKRANLRS